MLELDGDAEWSQEGPTLSNDIWKKFQLIPTPPRSPSHEADNMRHDTATDLASLGYTDLTALALEDTLPGLEDHDFGLEDHDFGLALDNIDLFPDHLADCGPSGPPGGPTGVPCAHGTCTSCTQLALAGSELRHDCMWRGTCTAEAHTYHPHDLHHHHHHHHHHSHRDDLHDLLMDTASALESAAGFTRLHDFDHEDDLDDDDDDQDDMEVEDDHHLAARPDTPSESSETDTDEEEQQDDYEDDQQDDQATTPAVHVDHSYHCPRAPSPLHAYAPALPHTPSESEDEIDVVSVGSPDSAYSSSSSRSTPSSRVGGEKRKRGASRTSGGDPTTIQPSSPTPAIPSTTTPALPTAATTTFVTTGLKKIVKIRTSSLHTTSKSRHRRSSGSNGSSSTSSSSKRRAITSTTDPTSFTSPAHHSTNTTVSLRRTSTTTSSSSTHTTSAYSKNVKRIRNHHSSSNSIHSRKRRGNKGESDDPERRHLHNSLERMRRVDLRNAFEELRALVPGLCDKDKAPKVEILRRASEHCYSVTQRGRLLEQEKERQRRLQGELKKRLASLQRRA